MSGLVAGAMWGGLGQGIAQFGATMSALERERERLEEARALKREELAAKLADAASARREKYDAQDREQQMRLQERRIAADGSERAARVQYGSDATPEQIISQIAANEGLTLAEAKAVYQQEVAGKTMAETGPTLEEPAKPESFEVDREEMKRRGAARTKGMRDATMLSRPSQADDLAKGQGTARDTDLRDGIINGAADPAKVARGTLATKTGEMFSMNGGSVLEKSSGRTATTEVGEAEAAKDRAAAAADAPGSAKNYRTDLGLISERRKNLDNEINTQRNLMKEAVANTYSQDGKNKIIADYTASIKELEKRRGELDRQMDELQARISGQRAGPAAPARTGGTLPPTAKGVSNAWQQYQQMKGR